MSSLASLLSCLALSWLLASGAPRATAHSGAAPLRVSSALASPARVTLVSTQPGASARPQEVSSLAPALDDPERFGELPDFEFQGADGRSWSRTDLLGQPWVCVLFFSSCSGPCPRLSADVRALLHDQLADTDVRIVSLSVDPEVDTQEVLREYAESYSADPQRWLFLTGEEARIHAFVREGLRLAVGRPPAGLGGGESAPGESESAESESGAGPGQAIARLSERMQMTHSTRLVAVDAEGRIAGWYECGDDLGESRRVVEQSFGRLLDRLRCLAGRAPIAGPRGARIIPAINACLNATAALFLMLGLFAIGREDRERHRFWMLSAFVVSTVFLVLYVYYHVAVIPLSGGPTKFNVTGPWHTAYLLMLASHVILAAVNLPMVLRTLWLAHRERWDSHRRWARWTFPIWMYVSLTGVLVYLLLYVFNPR